MNIRDPQAIAGAMVFSACTEPPSSGEAQPAIESADDAGIVMVDGIKKKRIEGFGGIIAEHNDESEE